MKVLVFEQKPDNRLGGQERSLHEVCRGLWERGVQIHLVYREKGNLLPDYETFCWATTQLQEPYFLDHRGPFGFFRALVKLVRLSKDSPADLIYINQFMDVTLPAALSTVIKRPLVAHLRLPPGPYLSRQYLLGLRRCERLIAISEHTMGLYRKKGIRSEKFTVIYNGVDLRRFAPAARRVDQDSGRFILYLGRIVPAKGIATLLDAFQALSLERSDVTLAIVGNCRPNTEGEEFLNGLKSNAAAGAGAERIEFASHETDIRPRLGQADLLVLPSEWDEPFGRVLIEAMSMGVPVVAARAGGIPEILGQEFESHLFKPGDSSALASAIQQTIDWRDQDPDLGGRSRKYVEERFGKETTIDRLAQVLRECAG